MDTTLHFLVGPTASGKTAVALEVAERAGAELISMDSMLVYRGLDIGVAKPDAGERARVPHHALDLVEPSESFSVNDYLAEARRALESCASRGRRALFVGGTAFYLKALVQGLFEGPEVDPHVREALEQRYATEGAEALHAELGRVDPRLAARIHRNDRKRVVRALEVFVQTGKPLSEWQTEWGWHGAEAARTPPSRMAGLALETQELDARIARRASRMLDAGWVEEALAVRAGCGFGPTASQALGYAEVLAFADGRLTRADCEAQIVLRTRQFARKQRTWLRKFEDVQWTAAPDDAPAGEACGKKRDPASVAGEVSSLLGWS
jgi:tRNA dimethylallyltransferase